MSFDKHSNFNKQANFTEVKFGENKPVLEVELNELQQIQNEARADIIRDSIPSGFTQLGDIDYEYCLNNENKIKLKTDSVAYVNGYRITIPKDTIIDIGKAPEKDAREDLVFLEVWKEEVNSTSTLYKEGGEGQVEIPNNIKDSRYPIETTHRVALKWRIRHHANADFVNLIEGLYCPESVRYEQTPFAQGGLDNAFTFEDMGRNLDFAYVHRFRPASKYYNATDWTRTNNDVGLYVAGGGKYPGITEMHKFKSFDGYVYAIPMFRLYRKPSCGKSIPFEYSKINPKVDYGKFTKLIKEDKVERVVNEEITGRSLVNICSCNPTRGASDLNTFTNEFNIYVKDVTLIFYNMPNGKNLSVSERNLTTSEWVRNTFLDLSPSNPKIYIPKKDNTIYGGIVGSSTPAYGEWTFDEFKSMKILALEGDWTNKEIPEYFEGLKSLGEDDGNLITVKNGILNDDTYDINDGNQKLNTFSSVTHVLSENTIIPTIEAVVNKGDDSTPLEKLNSKLETEGNEIVEFTKIKGKTLQNLSKTKNGTLNYSPVPSSDLWISLAHSLKTNTDYTLIFDITTNTLDASFNLALQYEDTVLWKNLTTQGKLGEFRYVFNADTPISIIRVYTDNSNSGKVVLDNIRLVEGNYSDFSYENLPYIEGIKSVGENEGNVIEILSQGKNLCKSFDKWTLHANSKLVSSSEILVTNVGRSDSPKIKAKPNTQYTVQYEGDSARCFIRELDNFGSEIRYTVYTDNTFIVTTGDGCEYIDFSINPSSSESFPKTIKNIIISNNNTPTQYQPYCQDKTQISLSSPLRSLPNGICDEIVGNKVIRRVGKVILDESTDIRVDTAFNQSNTIAFVINNPGLRNKDNGSLLSSLLPPVDGDTYWNTDIECIMSANELYFKFRVLKTKLDSLDNDGIKKWLKSNPITVYYELLNPIDEYLENVYEKESIKTYQLEEPLRALPNGVKDEIKDGVLIRRCKEIILNGSENWERALSVDESTYYFTCPLSIPTTGIVFEFDNQIADKLPIKNPYEDGEFNSIWCLHNQGESSVRIKLIGVKDVVDLKSWLQKNPVKVIYEMATPTETILKEVKPQTADFSLDRQFAEGNYLRELPNGVKDTVENGKVIRRVGKVVLNGSETWQFDQGNMLKNTLMFSSPLVCSSTSNYVLSNKFDSDNTLDNGWETDTETICVVLGSKIRIRILKSKLATQDVRGLTTWLQQNPTTVLYELATPVEETLSTDNYMSYPSHEFNTYCGSMYVGEGRNYVISDNKMPTEDTIVVETDFREIEGKAKVEDCNFKKSDEGYDTPYISSSSKNLLDISTSNILTKDYSKNYKFNYTESNNGFTISNNTANSYASIRFRVYLKSGVSYRIEYAQTGPYSFVDLKTLGLEFICNLNSNRVFKVTNSDYYSVNFYCTGSVSTTSTATFTDIRITEGETSVPFEPCNKTTKYLENTEENDIDDLRHQVSLTGFNYDKILNESFDKLLRGEL